MLTHVIYICQHPQDLSGLSVIDRDQGLFSFMECSLSIRVVPNSGRQRRSKELTNHLGMVGETCDCTSPASQGCKSSKDQTLKLPLFGNCTEIHLTDDGIVDAFHWENDIPLSGTQLADVWFKEYSPVSPDGTIKFRPDKIGRWDSKVPEFKAGDPLCIQRIDCSR
jgi:hypothetical protein